MATAELLTQASCLCETPLGTVRITEDQQGITALYFVEDTTLPPPDGAGRYLDDARQQLLEYFFQARRTFSLPLSTHGTPFQEAVWQALRDIPYGETRSYQQIAEKIGRPNAARAVGMANNRNPVCILIPCHRVVGADGSLVGYAGGLSRKASLLALEQPLQNA